MPRKKKPDPKDEPKKLDATKKPKAEPPAADERGARLMEFLATYPDKSLADFAKDLTQLGNIRAIELEAQRVARRVANLAEMLKDAKHEYSAVVSRLRRAAASVDDDFPLLADDKDGDAADSVAELVGNEHAGDVCKIPGFKPEIDKRNWRTLDPANDDHCPAIVLEKLKQMNVKTIDELVAKMNARDLRTSSELSEFQQDHFGNYWSGLRIRFPDMVAALNDNLKREPGE